MTAEQKIDQIMDAAMNNVIEMTLKRAALLDGLDEHEAVLTLTLNLLRGEPPALALATKLAMLAVRWHRTRKLEASINNPEPGQ